MWLGQTLVAFYTLVVVASPFLLLAWIACDFKRRLRIIDMLVVVAISGVLMAGIASTALGNGIKTFLGCVMYGIPIVLMGLYLPRRWDWIAIGCWLAATLVVLGILLFLFPQD